MEVFRGGFSDYQNHTSNEKEYILENSKFQNDFNIKKWESDSSDTTIIVNEGAEDDYLDNQKQIIKRKQNSEVDSGNELFKKVYPKNSSNILANYEIAKGGNTRSTKVTEALYEKYVGNNEQKSKHLDILSKIKDEEIRQEREETRTKEDAQAISNMISRQEFYEKTKSVKKQDRQKKNSKKIKGECIFNPNGKNTSSRSPDAFYKEQKQFIVKKDETIKKMVQDKIDDEKEKSNIILLSKTSEKLASAKNPNETREEFCSRLAGEKLKIIKETIEKPKEVKKLTKKEIKNLTDKLHKEGETFRNNRIKKENERNSQLKTLGKDEFALQKSNKVLLDKFVNTFEKILLEIFNKNDNFSINYDEYKSILYNMGCIKLNSPSDEKLVKESFENFLEPHNGRIDTYAFLLFGLSALGLYKGNDEKINYPKSKVPVSNLEEEKSNENINFKSVNLNKKNPTRSLTKQSRHIKINKSIIKKQRTKTAKELISSYIPDLDLEKYGYPGKTARIIKHKFLPFISGLSQEWANNLNKKKKERQNKENENIIRTNLEEKKRLSSKLKREESIIHSYRRKLIEGENYQELCKTDGDSPKKGKCYRLEDMCLIMQKKKKRELENLKEIQVANELKECTFQPNLKTKPVNRNEVAKNIEKLYSEGKKSYIKKRSIESKENDINCTFKPSVRNYKGSYFNINPLKEDKLVKDELKKLEKIREEKGYTKKEIKSPMFFGIESRSNKDNIFSRVIPNKSEKGGNQTNDDIYEEDYREGELPLLKVEVNLDEFNNFDKLLIYRGDDVDEVINKFTNKHKLSDEKKNRLIKIIKSKIKEADYINEFRNTTG